MHMLGVNGQVYKL